jgi:hypothetical protein
LLLYPSVREEILSVAASKGELADAEKLVRDLDLALIELGELALQVDMTDLANNPEFCQRIRLESLEVRRAAEKFQGISDTSNHLALLFRELADWLDSEFVTESGFQRRSGSGNRHHN